MAFKMKMTLRGIEPKVTRTVTVPEDFTYSDLHPVVKKLMGWNGDGAYAFYTPRTGSYATPQDNPLEGDFINSGDVSAPLSDSERNPFRYIYRSDERWQVDIEFQKNSSEPDFTILKWNGDAPYEGKGGPAEYKKHPKYFPKTPFDPVAVAASLAPSPALDKVVETPVEEVVEEPVVEAVVEEVIEETVEVIEEPAEASASDLPEDVFSRDQVLELAGYMTEDLSEDVYYIPSARRFVKVEIDTEPDEEDAIPVVMAEEYLGIYTAEVFIKSATPDMGIDVTSIQRMRLHDPETHGMAEFLAMIEEEGLQEMWDSTKMVMGERTARQWLQDNGFTIEDESGKPLDSSGSLDFVSVLMAQVDQMHLDSVKIPCRGCGSPCNGVIDKSLPPTVVSKIPHYAARVSCPVCGLSSVICLINDGYRRNYAYQSDRMVYPNYLNLIALENATEVEADPVRRAELLIDLAIEYNKVSELANASDASLEALNIMEDCDVKGENFETYYKVVSVAGMCNLNNLGSFQKHIDRLKRRIDSMHGLFGAAFAVVCAFKSTSVKAIRNYTEKAVAMMSEVEGYDWFKIDLMEGLAIRILREVKGDETALGLLEEAFRHLLTFAPASELMGPSTNLRQLAKIFEIYMGQLEIAQDYERAEAAMDLMEQAFPFQTSPEGSMIILWTFRRGVHEILKNEDCGDAMNYFSMMDQACLRTMELGTYSTTRRCYAAAFTCICGTPDKRILSDSFDTMLSMFELKSITYLEFGAFMNIFSSCAKQAFDKEEVLEMMLRNNKANDFFKDVVDRMVFDKSMLLGYEDIFLT